MENTNGAVNNNEAEKKHNWLTDAAQQANHDFPLSGGADENDLPVSADEDEHTSFTHDLDTKFPLSGGETEEDLPSSDTDASENTSEHTSFLHDIDTNFPLSGGVSEGQEEDEA